MFVLLETADIKRQRKACKLNWRYKQLDLTILCMFLQLMGEIEPVTV